MKLHICAAAQRSFFSLVLVCFPVVAAVAEPNTLTEVEKKAGWKLLFDGQSLNEWRSYQADSVDSNWGVEDGAIVRVASGRDLVTKKKFKNFELMIQFKIARGGNSGLIFRATEEGEATWHTGPEIQIIDNGIVTGDGPTTGAVYGLYSAPREAARPAGTWNELHLVVKPDGCVTYLNGTVCNRYQIGDAEWNRRVAGSKFNQYEDFAKAKSGHICLQDHGSQIEFRNIKVREFTGDEARLNPVDGPLALKPVRVFEQLEWADWSPISEEGRSEPFRAVDITHAGDGSDRLFVCTQRGVIYVFENRDDVTQSKVFLDISQQTRFLNREFERGLLGLAFHPDYQENGEFFICYTTDERNSFDSVVSRYRVDPRDPDRALPESEREVMRVKQPYWNHNGGTVLFGPDGYLYIALGDGGAGGDPHRNGQNLGNFFGKILRIDVDHTSGNAGYSIPGDNPFVNRSGARSEIWAYGLRNVWRMAFDRETGRLWAADVGQDLFEEINMIRRGGNYGWSFREGMHRFGSHVANPKADLIEPIWEYDHQVGVSITGGLVYRGERLPELQGCYVYADFISGKLWALRYDEESQRVLGNYEIPGPSLPVTSFGEDQHGELYFTTVDANGHSVYKFESTAGSDG